MADSRAKPSENTTPELVELHELARAVKKSGSFDVGMVRGDFPVPSVIFSKAAGSLEAIVSISTEADAFVYTVSPFYQGRVAAVEQLGFAHPAIVGSRDAALERVAAISAGSADVDLAVEDSDSDDSHVDPALAAASAAERDLWRGEVFNPLVHPVELLLVAREEARKSSVWIRSRTGRTNGYDLLDFDDVIANSVGWPVLRTWWLSDAARLAVEHDNALAFHAAMRHSRAIVLGAMGVEALSVLEQLGWAIIAVRRERASLLLNLRARRQKREAAGEPQTQPTDHDIESVIASGKLVVRAIVRGLISRARTHMMPSPVFGSFSSAFEAVEKAELKRVFCFAVSGSGKTYEIDQRVPKRGTAGID